MIQHVHESLIQVETGKSYRVSYYLINLILLL
jgi:hypothetical protein